MAYWSNTSHSHDGERPTLPPIRDLFHDLRTPHDTPSLTLARLRVSDDYDDPTSRASVRPSSAQSNYRPTREQLSRSQTPLSNHYESRQIHQNLQVLPSLFDRTSPSPARSSEPFSTMPVYSYESHNPGARHSLPYAREPSDIPSYVMRRHSSLTVPSESYINPLSSEEERTPIARYTPRAYDFPDHHQAPRQPTWPGDISTGGPFMGRKDDQRTPIARFGGNASHGAPPFPKASEDNHNGAVVSKYECNYCGKGFNRPSSLKIHLNSHTGAKPFLCPVENCGRSFSVLSNMRRHARVHTQIPSHNDPSSDEDSERSSSFTGSAPPSATLSHSRSGSTASVSSSGSRRSHASDDDSAHDDARPEKRSRTHPK